MLIYCELKKLEQKLLEKSSLKERVFYRFLLKKPIKYKPEKKLSDIQQICLSMFGLNAFVDRDLIDQKRRSKVTGRKHYTQNLIDLAAMAKDNLEEERGNLISYCQNHSTRDFYILNHLFQDISRDPPIPQGDIDEIALHLYEGDFPSEGWKSLLFRALQVTSDLHDLYVIEQGYQQAMDDHPIIHQVNDILYVKNDCEKFVKKTERNVKLSIGIVLFLLLVGICFLIPTIREKWNEVEPFFGIAGILLILIVELIFIFRGKVLDRTKFTKMLIEKITNFVFKTKGFNRLELKEKLDSLQNHDEN